MCYLGRIAARRLLAADGSISALVIKCPSVFRRQAVSGSGMAASKKGLIDPIVGSIIHNYEDLTLWTAVSMPLEGDPDHG